MIRSHGCAPCAIAQFSLGTLALGLKSHAALINRPLFLQPRLAYRSERQWDTIDLTSKMSTKILYIGFILLNRGFGSTADAGSGGSWRGQPLARPCEYCLRAARLGVCACGHLIGESSFLDVDSNMRHYLGRAGAAGDASRQSRISQP